MTYEIGERRLYNQLLYLDHLFDVDKTVERLGKKKIGAVKVEESENESRQKEIVVAETNRERWEIYRKVVAGYLEKSGWAWVSMESVFGFALKAL